MSDDTEYLPRFRTEVEAFLAETGMAPATFGRKCVRDGSFVDDLRAGREFRPSTVAKVRSWMREHRARCEAAKASAAGDDPERRRGYRRVA